VISVQTKIGSYSVLKPVLKPNPNRFLVFCTPLILEHFSQASKGSTVDHVLLGHTVTYNGGLDPLVANDFNFILVISRPIRYLTEVAL